MVAREVGHEVNQPNMMLAIYAVASEQLNPLHLTSRDKTRSGHDDPLCKTRLFLLSLQLETIVYITKNDLTELKSISSKGEQQH